MRAVCQKWILDIPPSSRSNVSVVPDKERCLKINAIAALSN